VRRAPLFHDRREAGRRLAGQLTEYAGRSDVVVVALPRGGVPVGFEVARALGARLDVFVVRKVGFPGREELAIGAVASGGVRVVNDEAVRQYGVPEEAVAQAVDRAELEVREREAELRGDRPPQPLAGRTAIVVDDGLATGMTMRAALLALRERRVAELVVAVPVAPAAVCRGLVGLADLVVCGRTPEPFEAVGAWYVDFEQTETAEVRRLLAAAREASRGA
jgi:putative phosphoribosyl transferase